MSEGAGRGLGRIVSEVAVIVIGVLIALFAESAWAERGERVEEAAVLQRLADELAEDSVVFEGLDVWVSVVGGSIERTQIVFEGVSTLTPSAQLANVYGAATVWRLASPTATWDELVQAGRLTLVEDADLRRLAVRYYDQRRQTQDGLERLGEDPYRLGVVSTLPSEYTIGVLVSCSRAPGVTPGVAADEATVMVGANDRLDQCGIEPAGGADRWLQRIRGDEEMQRALGERSYRVQILSEQMERARTSRLELRERLRELGFEPGR